MSSFSGYERWFASALSSSPKVKKYMKICYQYLMYIFYKKKASFICSYNIEKVSSDVSGISDFFGYYDKNPYNGKYTLLQRTLHDTRIKPSKLTHEPGKYFITVVDELGDTVFECESNAFNWQQGSKIQWLSNVEFIFNDIVSGNIVSKVIDVETGLIKQYSYPVYDSCPKFYLSLDYRPLTKLRPDYGYFSCDLNEKIDMSKQSIFRVEFDGGVKKIIDISSILEDYPLEPACSFDNQKFNHIMLSPDSSSFVFLHRYYLESGKRVDRFFVSKSSGLDSSLKMISDSGMISHYTWIDNQSLIVYMKHNDINGYYKVSLDEEIEISLIDVEGLHKYGDGHPTYIGNDKFITDTYPDKSRMKHLLLVNIGGNSVEVIGSFFEPLDYREQCRCDLHPKWDSINGYVYIDSTHEKVRSLYKIGPIL